MAKTRQYVCDVGIFKGSCNPLNYNMLHDRTHAMENMWCMWDMFAGCAVAEDMLGEWRHE